MVKNNKVVERSYREWSRQQAPVPPGHPPANEDGESWTETGDQLGKHPKGAPAKTLDELYADAGKIVETKLEPSMRLSVLLDQQGLLNCCFYRDSRIADDAPMTGVSIQNIQLKMPPPH